MSRVLAVASVPVSAECPDGFSRRYRHLFPALCAQHEVRLVEAVPPHYQQAAYPPDPGCGAAEIVRPADVTLPGGPGPGERQRRRWQFVAGRWPSRSVFPPREVVAAGSPDVVLTLGPDVVPATLDVHPGVPRVHLLDEAWERTLLPDLRALPGWKGGWGARAEPARYRRLYRAMDRPGDVVLTIAEHERAYLSTFFSRAAVEVLPQGLDPSDWAPIDVERDLDVVIVGALGQSRNLRPVLDFFAATDRPGMRWGLVGAETPPEVLALASDRVLVPGRVPDVRPWYARARVVVVPSLVAAGVKNTVLEPCAMARPVVATVASARGVPADVATGATIAELAAATHRLLGDPDAAEAAARRASDVVAAACDVRRISEDFAARVADVAR